jgi:hypothetical protein
MSTTTNYTNFKVDSNDYLGTNHELFKNDMMEIALTKPSEYFELRKKVLLAVKKDAVSNAYEIYYNLLTEGKDLRGAPIAPTGGGKSYSGLFTPCISKQIVNQFSLKVAKTVDSIAEEAIEMILPKDYRKIAESRTSQKTAGDLGFN